MRYAVPLHLNTFLTHGKQIRMRDAEDYNNLKITLENNIQLLEQQFEEMKATYQLNAEVDSL